MSFLTTYMQKSSEKFSNRLYLNDTMYNYYKGRYIYHLPVNTQSLLGLMRGRHGMQQLLLFGETTSAGAGQTEEACVCSHRVHFIYLECNEWVCLSVVR